MIEDETPEVLQHKRLGHKLGGVRGIYSHVTQPMIDKLLAGLQRRWEQTGSTNQGDHYQDANVVKIDCSQSAPTSVEQPASGDHQRAV